MRRIYKTVDIEQLRKMGRDIMEFHADVTKAAADERERVIDGLASTGDTDRMGDVIEPEAFKKTFKKFLGGKQGNPVMLAHHDPEQSVGLFTGGEVLDAGLRVQGFIGKGTDPTDTPERIWNRVDQRILRALSIGFRINRREDILEGGTVIGWRILDLDLFEISVVAIPANPFAIFNIAKAVRNGTDLDYDLYGRGLWGIPPFQTKRTVPTHADITRLERAHTGLAQVLAANSGG